MQTYPDVGLYCPAKDEHTERRNRLLAAFSEDAIYLHCVEHDWIRIELSVFGKKISFKGITAIATQVAPETGDKVLFELKPMSVHGRGKFHMRKRNWRTSSK